MATTKRRKNVWQKVILVLCFVLILGTFVCAAVATGKSAKLQAKVTKLEKEVNALQKDEKLILKCGQEKMIPDFTNGITKETVNSFSVETSYPITLYQVVGKDGKILQNSLYEMKKGVQNDTFKFAEDVTNEVSEIRIAGYDKEGNHIESRNFIIVFTN